MIGWLLIFIKAPDHSLKVISIFMRPIIAEILILKKKAVTVVLKQAIQNSSVINKLTLRKKPEIFINIRRRHLSLLSPFRAIITSNFAKPPTGTLSEPVMN